MLLAILLAVPSSAKAKHTFEIKDGNFVYDGKAIQIHSGEMHYSRVPAPYWHHRLKMMKAMGLNAVATYVFWNNHEVAPGKWDWTTGSRNIRAFLKAASDEGMMVILRPGPYACGEWEFGGYPWWLQKVKGMEIRTYNQPFLDSCRVYINELAAQVADYQITKGGPIVMVQAENEFGSYVEQRPDVSLEMHRKYSGAIKDMLIEAGFNIPMFTSDGSWLFEGGVIDGALPTANGEDDVENLRNTVNQYHGGVGPYMVAEFYPGWLDHWNEPFVKRTAERMVKQTKKYLDAGVSFNYYMVHGGTNFGFTAGANYNHTWRNYTLGVNLNGRFQSATYYPGYENAPGYGVINLNTTHTFTIGKMFKLVPSVGIDNIFNKTDHRTDTPLQKVALYSPGRMLVVGLKVNFAK